MAEQLVLFDDLVEVTPDIKASRSGAFVDNMALPIHRWFRYSAGFAASWVEDVLADWNVRADQTVLDPFAGSGTAPIVCDSMGVKSVGIEAHPVVARICKTKLLWETSPVQFGKLASEVFNRSQSQTPDIASYPPLIQQSFTPDALETLDRLKLAWSSLQNASPESELVWLALTSILRPTSRAGTAQWQYILPQKTKKKVVQPLTAFQAQVEVMKADLRWMQSQAQRSRASIIKGDARSLADFNLPGIDYVITSPPYANNYDYADALRFEMTFWGDVNGWGDIHDAVRKYLIVSSSQHSSREKLKSDEILRSDAIEPIRDELGAVMEQLAEIRETRGGKKHYHTMIGGYCRDISLVLKQLRKVCTPGARMCWVIGDSAPYGVYCPVEKWIAELAIAAGFKDYRFDKLRDRNIKWKNRKHRVPLKEGLLWIEG